MKAKGITIVIALMAVSIVGFGRDTARSEPIVVTVAADCSGQFKYLTAASTHDSQPFGFVFNNCRITAESPEVKTYLGRPWRDYSSTTFLKTETSAEVRPEGWNNWNLPEREKTSRYVEFNSSCPGANPKTRAAWTLTSYWRHAGRTPALPGKQ
jgi:pectin methylesterase-like acyl-CoA thioesterase